MEISELKGILREQEEEMKYLFNNERIIERETSEFAQRFLQYPNILSVIGIRRAGKSVFSYQLVMHKKYGYINFDDERLIGISAQELNRILEAMYEIHENVEYIVLDEPQNIKRWEIFANRLRRTKKVIVTGSSSALLKGELSRYLTGRHIEFELYPFSFREFLKYKKIQYGNDPTTYERAKIKKAFEEYLQYGGFPEQLKYGPRYVKQVYEDIIVRDVILRHGIRNEYNLKRMANFLISNTANEITYSKIKKRLGISRINTISSWVSYLREVFLLYEVERFSYKLSQPLLAPRKVYVADNGIISFAGRVIPGMRGRLLENLVFIELLRFSFLRGYKIFYWKSPEGYEVDFVLKNGTSVVSLIQVSYDVSDENVLKREKRALIKAKKELRCNNLLIITNDYEDIEKIQGNTIRFVPAWKWLITMKPGSQTKER